MICIYVYLHEIKMNKLSVKVFLKAAAPDDFLFYSFISYFEYRMNRRNNAPQGQALPS